MEFKNEKYKFLLILSFIILLFFNITYISSETREENRPIFKEKNTDRIPILTFHRLVTDEIKKKVYFNNRWIGSIEVFSRMMEWLYVNHYNTISTEEFYKWYKGEVEYNPKTILITFDDSYYDMYYLAYPILKKYNFKATSFLIGCKIKKKTPNFNKNVKGFIGEDVIERIRKIYPNIEFQSHSYNLHYKKKNIPIIHNMTTEELKKDTLANCRFHFTTMAYPYGARNKKIINVLKEQGYLCAFRFGPSGYATRNSCQYSIPRIKLDGFDNINEMIKWVKF